MRCITIRLGLGQLIAELIRHFLPGLDEEQIADLMEEVLPTSETKPMQVDTEELRAVLEGDAVVYEEQREGDFPTGPRAMESEIAEQAAKLRRAARKKNTSTSTQAAVAPEGQAAAAPGSADDATDAVAKGHHWTGKGSAHWTAQVYVFVFFVHNALTQQLIASLT